MKVSLAWKGKTYEIEIQSDTRGGALFNEAKKVSGLHPNRIRIVYESNQKRIPILPNQNIANLSVTKFTIRDLGPQFSYFGVFICEYFGPFVIWPIMKFIVHPEPNQYLTVASMMWTFHYFKRLAETIFVHVFSHSTMPLFNLFKNCTYYWGFAALIAYFVQRNAKNAPEMDKTSQNIIIALFFLFEALNCYCHIKLRSLRPKGSTAHVLPKGFLFDSITCPNYTMEILSWICFSVYVRVIPAYLFTICGAAQMFVWAGQKKKRLVQDYPEARRRGKITPFKFL